MSVRTFSLPSLLSLISSLLSSILSLPSLISDFISFSYIISISALSCFRFYHYF